MSRLLKNPKILAVIIVLAVLTLAGLAGGALGNQFGMGFLGSPMAHIQVPAEAITAEPLFDGFKITNTMIATWLAIAVLVLVAFLGTRRATDIPGRLQGLIEVIIEFFLNLTESVAGRERSRRFFPLVITIFLFIVTANWLGILPGFGTIGLVETADEVIHHAEKTAEENGDSVDLGKIKLQVFDGEGSVAVLPLGSVDQVITAEEYEKSGVAEGKQAGRLVPFLRSANTDINTTLAIALVAMFLVHWWGSRTLGFFSHLGKFINIRGGPVGLFVGILEGVSELARIISFTFRLFGNIFAGEVLLVAMAFLVPLTGLVIFLGLELFIGMIQAFIFAMLTLVFAVGATEAHTAEH